MRGFFFHAICKKYWKLLLSMLLVSAFGCAAYTGLAGGFLSLKEALNIYVQEGGYPDAFVTTDVTERQRMDALKAVAGVAEVNARIIGDLVLVNWDGRYLSIRAMSFDADEFQQFYFWDRADQGAYDPIYLEYNFAKTAGINVGDTVHVKVGGEFREYAVTGIVSRPETLSIEPSDDVSISSNDFGYAYAPRSLLEKEVNWEHRDAMLEWEEKRSELSEAEQAAKQDYESALSQLSQAETELQESKKELAEKREEMEEQLAELARNRDELKAAGKELSISKAEAILNQRKLSANKIQAKAKKAELQQAREELDKKRAELAETEQELLKQRDAFMEPFTEAQSQLSALEETEKQLLAGKEELSNARAETQKLQRELKLGQVELNNKRQEAERALSALRQAKSILSQLGQAVSMEQIRSEIDQQIDSAVQTLDAQLDGQEALQNQLKQNTDALRAQLNSLLGSVGVDGASSADVLDAAIAQAENGLRQIDNGLWTIRLALEEIEKGFAEADEKEAEIDDGLSQIQEGKEALEEILTQFDDGISQMKTGFGQIADGFAEMDDYQAQIDEGFSGLNEALFQLDEYQSQLKEAFIQIRDGREEIAQGLSQIQEAETQIRDGMAEAEQKISEGEDELNARRIEVENGWIEALAEFADLKNELQQAYEELSEWEGYQVFCNQFLLRFSPEASPDAVLEDVKKALSDAGVEVKSTVLYESSPIIRRINNNLIPIETMANFIPMIFFAIAMIVVYLFMSLMIRQCRREIGILRALGFTRFRVVSLFCGAGLLVSLGAVAFGLAVSLAVRGYFVHYFFDILFPLPIHVLVFSWPKFLLSAVLTLAAVETSTVVSALSISGIQPSEAMTRVKPSAVKIPRFVRWALRGASPFLKFSVISLLRNRLRFLFSVVCLAGSVMLIFTSRSLISSTNEILDRTFTRSIHYDCQIFISEKGADDLQRAVAALPYVSDVERMDYYTASFFLNGHSESAKVVVVQENTRLLSVEDQKRNVLPITGDGVVLEKHLAERLGASIGDTVEVNGAPLRVSAVSEQCAARFQYMDDTHAYALGDCTLRSLICHVPVEYESEFMGFLVEQDGYLYAVFTHSAYSSCLFLLEGANLACWMLIGIAMIIGLVIVVNTSQTNLLEQKRELCVLRTLGFQHSELSLYWFAQSLLHFLCSCVLGFPAGIAMAKRAIQNMEMELYTYTFVNNPWDYAVTAGLVFVYMVFSHFLSMRSLRRWDIVECVKDKE
ncbi:MAG: FtsX-like permease family protein [Clostridia bacterium]|nr:FtsX-like permease family protein [Clostridia bacterium]